MAIFNLPVMTLSDRTAPVISGTSVGNPIALDENVATSSLVATVTDDGTAVSFAIVSGNTNGDFHIANNGDITVVNSPDYETTTAYSLGITATDRLGNTSAPFTLTINITDIDEDAPIVTLVSQPYVAVFETENNLTIASFTASDAGSDVTSTLTLASGTPNATNFSLSYNNATQQMDLVTSASGQLGGGVTANQTFTFTISATDSLGNTGSTTCNLLVKNAELPTVTGPTSISKQENTLTTAVIGTCTASGTGPFSWSITGGSDASYFTVDSTTGQLRFATSPNYEQPGDSDTDNVYEVEVTATNQFGTGSGTISVTVTDDPIDEAVYYAWGHSFTGLDADRYELLSLTSFNSSLYALASSSSLSSQTGLPYDGYNPLLLVKADPTTGNWTVNNTISSQYEKVGGLYSYRGRTLAVGGSYLYGFVYRSSNNTNYSMRISGSGVGQSFTAATSSINLKYADAIVEVSGSSTEAWGFRDTGDRWDKYSLSTGAIVSGTTTINPTNYPSGNASTAYRVPEGKGVNVGNYAGDFVIFANARGSLGQGQNRQNINAFKAPTAANISNGTAFNFYGQITLASFPFTPKNNYVITGMAIIGSHLYLSTQDANNVHRVVRYDAPLSQSANILATLQLAE